MSRSRLGLIIAVLCALTIVLGACMGSASQDTSTIDPALKMTAKPVEITSRAAPGGYLDVSFAVSGDQPCKLVLEKRQDAEYDNYLYPNASAPLVYPNADGNVVFHVLVPEDTTPGSYTLYLMQVTDGEEIQIYRQLGFIVAMEIEIKD